MGTIWVMKNRSPALTLLLEMIVAEGHPVREFAQPDLGWPNLGWTDPGGAASGTALALLDAPGELAAGESDGERDRPTRALGSLPLLLLESADQLADRAAGERLVGPWAGWLRSDLTLKEQYALVCSQLKLLQAQQGALALTVGDLHLDPGQGVLFCRQQLVRLTPTEFRVLHTLMRRPGQLIAHSMLEQLSGCRNVEAHLNSIRRKLSQFQPSPLLRGTRSLGYAIDSRRIPRIPRNAGLALKHTLLRLFQSDCSELTAPI